MTNQISSPAQASPCDCQGILYSGEGHVVPTNQHIPGVVCAEFGVIATSAMAQEVGSVSRDPNQQSLPGLEDGTQSLLDASLGPDSEVGIQSLLDAFPGSVIVE